MSSQRALQPASSGAQQAHGDLDVTARLRQVFGVSKRELLTMEEVAADYKFPSAEAARKFVRRYVRWERRGRRLLVDRRDFDAAMARMRKQSA